jgi:hypothetical protein
MLAKVGINATIENVECAQWVSGVYGQKAGDLTVISHAKPLDFGNFARLKYDWGYASTAFNTLWGRVQATVKPKKAEPADGATVNPGGKRQAQRFVKRQAAVCQQLGCAQLLLTLALSA